MNRVEIVERISKMLITSRTIAGKSQEYMAKALGVSKTSIQKWEDGSVPIQVVRVFEWFNALDIPPMPFVWGLIHKSLEDVKGDDSDEKVEEALIDAIKGMSAPAKRKLLYLFYGNHGSNGGALLELAVAYEQLALREKLDAANLIRLDYIVAKDRGELANASDEQPNIELLDSALQSAFQSVTHSKSYYTITGGDNEH